MFRIKTMNSISPAGIESLTARGCDVSADEVRPEALLLRSAELHGCEFNPELLAIGRAGAGYNNIPIPDCTEHGIVVFNSPGANAEAVKELELCSLVMASRDVLGSIGWVRGISGEGAAIPKLVEKGKSAFAGPELLGKTLGVIGLGAIGGLVANAAKGLGMKVYGCDPFITVEAAWGLSRSIEKAASYDEIFKTCDYITLHVPATKDTTGMINADTLSKMKDGVRIINLARAELVDSAALIEAVKSGKVAAYVTDFITDELVGVDERIICIPHLGASTEESEDKCAVMASRELIEYLENGNITHSVNFPDVSLPHNGDARICIMHRNVAGVLSKISTAVAEENVNIENMINRSRGNYAYTVVEIIGEIPDSVLEKLASIDSIIKIRVIK